MSNAKSLTSCERSESGPPIVERPRRRHSADRPLAAYVLIENTRFPRLGGTRWVFQRSCATPSVSELERDANSERVEKGDRHSFPS